MMKKKVSRILVAAALCTMLVSGPVSAATLAHFSFILENTGQEYSHYSGSMNKKVYISNPWTLKVQEISCSGPYGIRFIPVQCSSSGAIGKKCTQSGIWKSGTGYNTVAFASGEAALMNYKLGARKDDDYHAGYFKAEGWFNADRVSDQL